MVQLDKNMLKFLKLNCEIAVLTKQKKIPFKIIKDKKEVINYNPDYIILPNNTSNHIEYAIFGKKFKNKTINRKTNFK